VLESTTAETAMTSNQPTYRQMLFDLDHLGVGIREIADSTLIAYPILRHLRYADHTDVSIRYFRLQDLWKQRKVLGKVSASTSP
jgi:hypothetical protein